ncbi:MAG: hypothetical protein JXQ27_16450 [Acidobacteria bacterium]|nr:hypothetical protein [Acidobacteriota bacterium]
MIRVRRLESIDEYRQLADIQKSAWGFRDLEVEPYFLMTRAQMFGGLVQGLFVNDVLVGFTFAIAARRGDEHFLFSHMAAVRAEYQGRGYGFHLKAAQRAEALHMGYRTIRWSFDPLQSLNAFFNLHRLGVLGEAYERDIYGPGQAGLHEGLPTDRILAVWRLDSTRVMERMAGKRPRLRKDLPSTYETDPVADVIFVEIPRDIRRLKQDDPAIARRWHETTRRDCEAAFARGHVITELVFTPDDQRVFYRLESPPAPGDAPDAPAG